MNSMLRVSVAACVVLFSCACSSSSQSLILGKWEVAGAKVGGTDLASADVAGAIKMTAEFGRDGTAKITMFGQTLQGTYKLDAGNEMEWTLNGVTTKSKVNVTPTELELTDDANRTIRYKRK